MRPMLIFLCSKLLNSGKVNDKVYRGASVIELIHTATLIHDDVVDESNKRRGFFSINAIWKNKIAVLVGDFLILISILGYVAISSEFKWDLWFEAVEFAVEGTPQLIAGTLFTAWIFPFEIISILLIVATAAAIALAYDSKRKKNDV